MPFDDRELPAARALDPGDRAGRDRRWLAAWLGVVAGMVFVMIVLGGATRLTGSGLSIMEWAPLSGIIPPWSEQEWERLFTLYRGIPQFALVNSDFSLADFRHIFWLEWMHRLWGRLIGIAFAVPLLWFALRGMIGARLLPKLLLLLALGGLQGAVGWLMVASGFEADAISVSPYRLVAHLVLALGLYAALVWTAISLWDDGPREAGPRGLRIMAGLVLASVSLTIVAGGFVAGLHAGLSYNTFPLMQGRLVPPGYADLVPFVRNLTENAASVQFDHRVLATVTAILAIATAGAGLAAGAARSTFIVMAGAVVLQYALGVATLLGVVPVGLAVAHQACAALLLTAALATLNQLQCGRRQ